MDENDKLIKKVLELLDYSLMGFIIVLWEDLFFSYFFLQYYVFKLFAFTLFTLR